MCSFSDNFVGAQALEVIAFIMYVLAPFVVGVYVFASAARVRCLAIFAMTVCFCACE